MATATQLKTHTKARLQMNGLTPFVMNSIEHADPEDPLAVEIKALTDKGSKMTPEERAQRDALRWRASLYLDQSGALVFPTRHLIVALSEAGAGVGAGKKTAIMERGAIAPVELEMRLDYETPDGAQGGGKPADLRGLYADQRYILRAMVNGNPSGGRRKSMVPLVRPTFPRWSMTTDLIVYHSEIGWDEFIQVVETAGRVGLGNGRKIGMGRFSAEVTQL